TCRLEARQVLVYQCISDLTGENGKYNYSKAVHLSPAFSDIFLSAKNYKIASALTVHMTKRGSPYLRRAIWMAGAIAVQFDPMFKAYYEKKSAEGLRYMNIIGHVSKKMTAVIFAVMRDNKIYKPVLPAA
ncbi:MAG: transposase, partial [Ruminococcus flavefaciens]|nr:transposase [Ruminococcus flavefaciens]